MWHEQSGGGPTCLRSSQLFHRKNKIPCEDVQWGGGYLGICDKFDHMVLKRSHSNLVCFHTNCYFILFFISQVLF